MSKSVTVEINGKENISAISQLASGGLDGLAKAALGAAGGAAALQIFDKVSETFQRVKQFASECEQEFAKNEKAALSLSKAIEISPFWNSSAATQLDSFTSSMSRMSCA